jgi:hypothetical protein
MISTEYKIKLREIKEAVDDPNTSFRDAPDASTRSDKYIPQTIIN